MNTPIDGGEKFNDYISRNGRNGVGRKDLLTKVITGDPKLAPLSDKVIISEVGSLIIGGTDTTSNTLTFTCYELTKHRQWQQRLRHELQQHNVQFPAGVAAYKDVRDLPVLDAIVTEGLRMHPAAPSTLPRVVPVGGAVIGGVKLPAGVRKNFPSFFLSFRLFSLCYPLLGLIDGLVIVSCRFSCSDLPQKKREGGEEGGEYKKEKKENDACDWLLCV